MAKEIWVNARYLTQQKTGVQHYAIEISRALKSIYPTVKFIAPKKNLNKELAKELEVLTIGNNSGTVWEQYDLPKFLKKKNEPLLINLSNTAPLNYLNNVITIHDLAFIENSKWFSFYFRTWYNYLIPRIARKAKQIFTVSQFSKNEIQSKLSIDKAKINITYNGLSQELIEWKTKNKKEIPKEKIILAVGSINPRKNLKELINAFNNLQLKDFQLLIIGEKNSNYKSEEFNSTNNIKFLGYINNHELWKLYQKAILLVYPSLYEGFGLPILEASFLGCNVVANDLLVYQEVYATFEINYSKGNKAKDYEEVIKKVVEQNTKLELDADLFKEFSYQKEAEKMIEIISNMN